MKKKLARLLFTGAIVTIVLTSCNSASKEKSTAADSTSTSATNVTGQSAVQDDVSQKNVVQVASGSADHTTLVAAVKAGSLVDALSNAGPFTVFAPTNAAFAKLPAGTVDDLLKPENKEKLQDILQYHVSVGVFKTENMTDGQVIGQVNGGDVKIAVKDGKYTVNGANIVASIPASNGIIHVIDAVLLPPTDKK